MRVLLCYPHRPDAYHKIGFVLPPLGLGYLASVLRDNGHQPDIIDFNLGDRQPEYGAYDVVGISCDTSRVKEGCEIARQAKAAGKTVVMGGPHPTFNDREMLETGFCDYVVRGEGEWVFLDLMNSLRSGKDITGVQGISFVSEQKKVIRTPDAEPPDVRTLPRPARDLLRVTEYQRLEMGGRKITSLVTSRGCPHQCSFCSSSAFSGLKWRANDPGAVVDEVEEIVHGYGFNGIAFLDDNFTQDPDRVREICREVNRRNLDIFWWCFSRADIVLRHENMIAAMARAGARYVFMGFESRSAATLGYYRKKLDPGTAREAVRLLKSYGISTHGSFILGGMDETEEMALDTIRYAREIDPEAVQFSLLTPYPGTRLYDEVHERIFTHDWALYDCLHPVINLNHLTPEQLRKLLRKAYLSFYLTPRRIYNGLFSAIRGKGIRLSSMLRIIRGIQ